MDQARLNHETVRRATAEIGELYHPYNLNTGQGQDAQIVSALLGDRFDWHCAIKGFIDWVRSN